MGDWAGWRQRMGKAGQGQAWAVGDPQELMGVAPPFCGKGGGGFSCMHLAWIPLPPPLSFFFKNGPNVAYQDRKHHIHSCPVLLAPNPCAVWLSSARKCAFKSPIRTIDLT